MRATNPTKRRPRVQAALASAVILGVLAAGQAVGASLGFDLTSDESGPGNGSAESAVRQAALVDARSGWVLTRSALAWTSDGGSTWQDITPPGLDARQIGKVLFRSDGSGWVEASDSSGGKLSVYATHDYGRSWNAAPVPGATGIYGDAVPVSMAFSDSSSGMMLVPLPSSSNFSYGLLFATSDGGESWAALPRPPAAGVIGFTDPKTVWLGGGAAGNELYVSRDGGKTWQQTKVSPPDGYNVDDMTFGSATQIQGVDVLPVTLAGEAGKAAVAYYSSTSAEPWALSALSELQGGIGSGTQVPTAATSATHWIAADPSSATAPLVVTDHGSSRAIRPSTPLPDGIVSASFFDDQTGWVVIDHFACSDTKESCGQSSGLLSTHDGGQDWSSLPAPTAAADAAAN